MMYFVVEQVIVFSWYFETEHKLNSLPQCLLINLLSQTLHGGSGKAIR